MLTSDDYKHILENYVEHLENDIKIYRERMEKSNGFEYSMWYTMLETAKGCLANLKFYINELTNSSGLSFMKGEEHE